MSDVTAFWLRRDFLAVSGPDAASWLQGQLSQEVAALAVGSSRLSFLLQPQGKVDALLRVQRTDDDRFVLDVDGGFGDAVSARLLRFKLRTKADVDALDWKCLALRGPAAVRLAPGGVDPGWPGWTGVDVVGPEVELPGDLVARSDEAYEVARIEAGVPVMGREITDKTIPAELGPAIVERAVSFTKGCFTGQELVARIESRGGHVPRLLRRLDCDGVVAEGVALRLGDDDNGGGKVVGTVTSSATREDGTGVALGFVGRDVTPPATLTADDLGVEVRVTAIA